MTFPKWSIWTFLMCLLFGTVVNKVNVLSVKSQACGPEIMPKEYQTTRRDPRFLPNYGVTEAAHYLGLPVSTVRAWTKGMGSFKPVITAPGAGTQLSFVNLVEMYVLGAIRREHRISMPRVRKAIDFAIRELDTHHPLAVLDFRTDKRDLFVDFLGRIIDVSGVQGQTSIREVVTAYFERIERADDLFAERLFPFSRIGFDARVIRDQPRFIVIDPRVAFGRPVLMGTGVPTRAIADRFKAGESLSDLALDYRCERDLIEEAVRYEQQVAA